jgi:hypothetical protein
MLSLRSILQNDNSVEYHVLQVAPLVMLSLRSIFQSDYGGNNRYLQVYLKAEPGALDLRQRKMARAEVFPIL